MKKQSEIIEKISAGENASIENVQDTPLAVSFSCSNGCHLELEIVPGQAVSFSAGESDASIILHHGHPEGLLVIKPESAS